MNKILSLLLAAVLLASPLTATPARAQDDGGAGNGTLYIAAGVVVLALLVAWQMDFGDDAMAKAIENSILASNDEGDVGFGFEF